MTIRNATVSMDYVGVDGDASASFVVGVNSTVETRKVLETGNRDRLGACCR